MSSMIRPNVYKVIPACEPRSARALRWRTQAGQSMLEGMARFVLHWLMTAVALGIAARLVPGVRIASPQVLVIAALVLGFVNAVVRPILVLLTLPLTVLTL